MVTRASTGTPGDAIYVTEILAGTIKKAGGTKVKVSVVMFMSKML